MPRDGCTPIGLFNSTVKLKPWRKGYSSSSTRELNKIIPYVGTNSVAFFWDHEGLSMRKVKHRVQIQFYGLKISTAKINAPNYMKLSFDGETYWIQKPSMKDVKVRVRCSCPDFIYTFGNANDKAGCLAGPKIREYKYKRKTDRKPPPPRNPENIPGMCKHILNSFLWLQTKGFTADRPFRGSGA